MVTDTTLACSPYCPPPAINDKVAATRVVWHGPNAHVSIYIFIYIYIYATPTPVERTVRVEQPQWCPPVRADPFHSDRRGPAWVALVLLLKFHSLTPHHRIEGAKQRRLLLHCKLHCLHNAPPRKGAPHRNGVGGGDGLDSSFSGAGAALDVRQRPSWWVRRGGEVEGGSGGARVLHPRLRARWTGAVPALHPVRGLDSVVVCLFTFSTHWNQTEECLQMVINAGCDRAPLFVAEPATAFGRECSPGPDSSYLLSFPDGIYLAYTHKKYINT